jgi:hypothetical protein
MSTQGFGNKPGGKKQGTSSGTAGYEGGGNFWDFNPRAVAGVNPLQQGAANAVGGMAGAGSNFYNQANNYLRQLAGGGSGYAQQAIDAARSGTRMPGAFGEAGDYANQLRNVSQRQVTGEGLAKDPAILAAQDRFRKARLPMIQNMAAQAGLGRSNTAVNASALAQSNELLPLIQGGLAREERGIGREMSGIGAQIQNAMGRGGAELNMDQGNIQRLIASLSGAAGQESANLGSAASGAAGLGQQQSNQYNQAVNTAAGMGRELRGVEQEGLDAPYQEQQRLWAEALNSMYGPLGFLGNMGGATSTNRKK